MEQEKIANDISNLPPDARRQIVEYIAFLKTRYTRSWEEKQSRRTDLVNEPFIGIWKDCENMKDSGMWLRNMRKTEWGGTS